MTSNKEGIDQIIKIWDVIIESGNVAPKVHAAKTWIGKFVALALMTDELLALISLKLSDAYKAWATSIEGIVSPRIAE